MKSNSYVTNLLKLDADCACGHFCGASFGEDVGVAGQDDGGEDADERNVGDDQEHLAQKEEGRNTAHVRLHVLKIRTKMGFQKFRGFT